MATFSGDVHIKDPQFTLSADNLTVYFKKDKDAELATNRCRTHGDAAKPAAATTPGASSAAAAAPGAGGLERAIAEGNVVVESDRPDSNGGPPVHYVGKGAKVDYNAINGEAKLFMRGWPQIQQGDSTRLWPTGGMDCDSPFSGWDMKIDGGLTRWKSTIRARTNPPATPDAANSSAGKTRGGEITSTSGRKKPAGKSETCIPSNGKPLLQSEKLVKIYGGRAVVNGIDIGLKRGEIVGLLGPNGAGKTTSFYMIVGLVRPNGGRVLFEDKEVTDYPMYKRARMGMGYLPQEESIFRKLTVEQNIMAILETTKLNKVQRKNRCEELLSQFGIEHVAKQQALTLSGGEKRRLTIARSLVTEPSLLMLDEPFSGVDPIAVYDVQQIIVNLRKTGLGILITDHNVRETLSIVDRAYLIHEGKVLSEGTKEFLVNDPISRQFYLGERFKM